jgi:hypothetical protein
MRQPSTPALLPKEAAPSRRRHFADAAPVRGVRRALGAEDSTLRVAVAAGQQQ